LKKVGSKKNAEKGNELNDLTRMKLKKRAKIQLAQTYVVGHGCLIKIECLFKPRM
jgi:hypothetical protein